MLTILNKFVTSTTLQNKTFSICYSVALEMDAMLLSIYNSQRYSPSNLTLNSNGKIRELFLFALNAS